MKKLFLLTLLLVSSGIITAQNSKYDTLEAIITGSISIYKSRTNFYIEKRDTLYLLPPGTQQLVNVNGGVQMKTLAPYKGILNFHLSACSKITNQLKTLKLTEVDLIRLMKKYFECVGENPTYIEPSGKRTAIQLGLISGYQIGFIKPDSKKDDIDKASFESSNDIIYGIVYEFLLLKNKISAGGEHNFLNYNFSGKSLYKVGPTTVDNTFSVSYKQIQNRIFVKKYVKLGGINGFFKFGPAINLNMEFNQKWVKKEISGINVNEFNPGDFFIPTKISIGIHGSLGVEKALANQFFLSLEARYEALNVITEDSGQQTELVTPLLTFQIGLKYQITKTQ